MRPTPSSEPVRPVYQVRMARSSVSVTSSRLAGETSSSGAAAANLPNRRRSAVSGTAMATAVQRMKSRRVKSHPGTAGDSTAANSSTNRSGFQIRCHSAGFGSQNGQLGSVLGAPAAAAGGAHAEDVAGCEPAGALVREALGLALVAAGEEPVLPYRARAAAGETPGLGGATLGDERDGGGHEELDVPFDAVTAGMASAASRPGAELRPPDAQRVGALQRLDRRVLRVGHGGVDAAHASPEGPAALPAADGLVVHPGVLAGLGISGPADEDVV